MSAMLRTFVLRDAQNAKALWAFLKNNWMALAADGKPLAVTVQGHKAKRSTDQNKRYWALLNEIAESAWIGGRRYSAECWHEFFRGEFIGLDETPSGRLIGISSTTLSVAEFADYMARVEAYAATDLGVSIMQ